jgi:hypothetical protein
MKYLVISNILLLLILSDITYPQTFPVLGNNMSVNVFSLPQGYLLSNLCGSGYSKTIGDVSNILINFILSFRL